MVKIYNKNPKRNQLDFDNKINKKIIKAMIWVGAIILFFVTFPFSVVPGLGVVIYFNNKRKKHNFLKDSVVTIKNSPPDNLKPAEVAFLHDSNQGLDEIMATLFYLILEGHISMEIIKAKQNLNEGEYTLRLIQKDTSGLKKYEKMLLDRLFEDSVEITWHKFRTTQLSKNLSDISFALQQEMQVMGYYYFYEGYESEIYSEALKKASKNLILGFVKQIRHIGLGMSPYLTEKGMDTIVQIEGFRKYLQTAEEVRINFHADPEKGIVYIGDMMPYAVAMHINNTWQKELLGVGMVNELEVELGGDKKRRVERGHKNGLK